MDTQEPGPPLAALGETVPVLDSSTDGQPVTWWIYEVPTREVVEETAHEAVVIGGALVLRDGAGRLVRAYGPGSWGSFERKP